MKLPIRYFLSMAIIGVLLGCQKSDLGGLGTIENNHFRRTGHFPTDLATFYSLDSDGEIWIYNQQVFTQSGSLSLQELTLSASFRNHASQPLKGTLYVNNQRLLQNENTSFNSELKYPITSMGQFAKIDFKTAGSPVFDFEYEIFIPEQIELEATPQFISKGTKIFWNASDLSTNGVIVTLNFHHQSFGNNEFEDNYTNVQNILWLPLDKGMVELPESLFANIPNGGIVNFSISRTNIYYFTNPQNGINHLVTAVVKRDFNAKVGIP